MATWSYCLIVLTGSIIHLDAAPSIQSSHTDNELGNAESKITNPIFAISNEAAEISSPVDEILKREANQINSTTDSVAGDAVEAGEKVLKGIKDTGKGVKDTLDKLVAAPAKREASLEEGEAFAAPLINDPITASEVSEHDAPASTADEVGKRAVTPGEKLSQEIKEIIKAAAGKAEDALKDAGDKLTEPLAVPNANGATSSIEAVAPSTMDVSSPASELSEHDDLSSSGDEEESGAEQIESIFASGLGGHHYKNGYKKLKGFKRGKSVFPTRLRSQPATREVHAEGTTPPPSIDEEENIRVVKDLFNLLQGMGGAQEDVLSAPANGLKGVLKRKQAKKKPGKKAQIEEEGNDEDEEEEVRVVKDLEEVGGNQDELPLAPANGLKGVLKPKKSKKKPGKKAQIEEEENDDEEEGVRVVKRAEEPLKDLVPVPADGVTSPEEKEAEAVIASPTKEEEDEDEILAKVANATAEVFNRANEVIAHLSPAALL